jgi:hypothetical protein
MNKHGSNDQIDIRTSRHAKRARLQALLFTRAAFGTALVPPAGAMDPKIPPFVGE